MQEIIEGGVQPDNGGGAIVRMRKNDLTDGPLLGALLINVALKAALLYADVVPFNADEAVVALMGRHILQGERPVFFYGQAYLGSLDAWLVAGAFALFGQSVLAIRGVQSVLYLGVILTTYWLGLRIYASRWIAGAAALFLAVPSVLVTLYTTASLGGYGEALLIGNLVLLMALRLAEGKRRGAEWLALGFLSGLGFWGFPLIGVYLLPTVIYVFAARRWRMPDWLLSGLGFAAGASPWLWFTGTHSAATMTELGGAAIAGASASHPVFAIFQHLFNFLLLGLTVIWGMRPPWSAQFLALPLAPFALAINMAVVAFILRVVYPARPPDTVWVKRWLLIGVCLTLVGAFILTPFGADPSGRYFLPLAAPLALLMAEMLSKLRRHLRWAESPVGGWLVNALALGVIAFNAWGTAQSAADFPPGLTTQFDRVAQVDQRELPAVMAFLREHGETRGYTNYWVEFPLAFLSGEELLYAARLPYHLNFNYTTRYNRYLPYSQAADASPKAAYITTLHPQLDERIRTGLHTLGVTFEEEQIGDFHVFYALSRKVIPEELDLGRDCCSQ